jgi:GT2 family glycosyltransferase
MASTSNVQSDVSIVVIACDVRDEVIACLRSVEEHSGPVRVETILVDNASRDGTAEAVGAQFPKTTVIRLDKNHGLAARNFGLRVARGRTRMFLDSDALLSEGALSTLLSFLVHHPEVGLVGPRLVYPDGTLQLSARRYPPLLLPLLRRPPFARFFEDSAPVRRHLMADERHDETREVEYVIGACQLFTAEAQTAAGEIDPRMFFGPDDADWCFRIRNSALSIVYHPAATVVHDYRRASLQRPFSKIAFEQLRAFARFQWKWRHDRRRLIEEGREMDVRARRSTLGENDLGCE